MNKINSIKALLISPIIISLKRYYLPIFRKSELFFKCYNEGLYHMTKEENIINILESGYLKASSKYQSYGDKKVFLFAGIPTVEDICINASFKEKLVAIKINPTNEELSAFIYRSKDDEAIAYQGNLTLTDKQIEIVYLGLYKEKDNFLYKTISKEEYDNYKPNFDNKDFQNNFVRQLKSWIMGLNKQYEYTMNYFNNVKNNLSKNFQNKKK